MMLKLKTLYGLAFAMALSLPLMAGDDADSKGKAWVVVKMGRKMEGAKVEIWDKAHGFLAAQELKRKRLIIDFTSLEAGEYTIRVSNGTRTKAYPYVRASGPKTKKTSIRVSG